MTYIVEVQHSSDHNKDGKWFELERTDNKNTATKLLRYFGVRGPVPQGIRPHECRISGAYEGRQLRYRDEVSNFVYLDDIMSKG